MNPDRTIIIMGPISHETMESVIASIVSLDEQKHKDGIVVRICSDGGDISPALAVHDTIRQCQNEVVTEAWGEVCSSAFLIWSAGRKRLVAKHSRLMWHDGAFDAECVSPRAMAKLASEHAQLDGLCDQAVSEALGLHPSLIRKWSQQETYFTAEQAIDDGLAHGIIGA